MSTHALRFFSPAVIVAAAALSAVSVDAGDPLPLPEEYVEIAEPASGAAETVETDTRAGSAASVPDDEADRFTGSRTSAHGEAPPASRLLRSLDEWAERTAPASPVPSAETASPDAALAADPARIGGETGSSPAPGNSPVLHGCPRALLGGLLASAADAGDAVSALAIERETLTLCRERQEIVNGIVALEGELQGILAEAQGEAGVPGSKAGTAGTADSHIVKVSAPVPVPVRVIEVPTPPSVRAEAADPEDSVTPPAPQPPAYSWFSIVGTAGNLRAGVGDGEGVWFVGEGDRLPGGVLITGIGTKPPSVRIGGAGEASLPYRPRSIDASIPSSGNADPGGHVAGEGR